MTADNLRLNTPYFSRFVVQRLGLTIKDQFRAIYYNAWEDDLCDDPLLSIIGQLSERFKKGNLETLADEMGKIAIPLLKKNAVSTLTSTLQGTTIHTDFKRRRRQVCAAPD